MCAISWTRKTAPLSHTWMTCAFLHRPSGHVTGTISLNSSCWLGLGSNYTRAQRECGIVQVRVADVGEGVWSPDGIKIFGHADGSLEFVHSFIERRLEDEGRLWKAVTWVPDLSCRFSCSVLGHIATTCFAHCPPVSPQYVFHHDIDRPRVRFTGKEEDQLTARSGIIADASRRLRSAARMAPAAFWSSRADERFPLEARNVVDRLDGVQEAEGCIRELHDVTIVGSSRVRRAPGLGRVGMLHPANVTELGNGHMVGTISRLPFLSATSGRPRCCVSHVPVIRPTCGPTLRVAWMPHKTGVHS